jgi:hypothetical protein
MKAGDFFSAGGRVSLEIQADRTAESKGLDKVIERV